MSSVDGVSLHGSFGHLPVSSVSSLASFEFRRFFLFSLFHDYFLFSIGVSVSFSTFSLCRGDSPAMFVQCYSEDLTSFSGLSDFVGSSLGEW